MKMPFELGLYAGAAALAGWMAARGEYMATGILALVSLGALYDLQRGHRRDLNAARKWREQRWNAWKALEKTYRDEILTKMPPRRLRQQLISAGADEASMPLPQWLLVTKASLGLDD